MSQNSSKNKADQILSPSEISKLSSEKPLMLIPLWEILLGGIFALAFSLLFYFGAFSKLENHSIDFRFRQRGNLPKNQDIVIISITDDCLRDIGPWPWARAVHARLLSFLKSARAKTVAFDIIFNEESVLGKEDDQALADKIRGFGRIVLPVIFQHQDVWDNDLSEIVSKIVPERPIDIFRAAGASEGFIDLEYKSLNPDGVIRKLLLHRNDSDFISYIFGMAAAADYLGSKPVVEKNAIRIANRLVPLFSCYVPQAGASRQAFLINYVGPAESGQFNEVTYSQVLNGKIPESYFNNRLVMIGTSAKGTSEDLKFGPFGALPGVQVHANLLYNILSQRFLHRTSVETTIILIIFFALLLAYSLMKNVGYAVNLIWLGFSGFWGIIGVIVFKFDLVIEIVPICVMIPVQWSVTRLIQQFVSLRQKNYDLACKVRELAIINEVSKAVSFMGDLGKTLDAILSRGVQVLNAQRGSLFLLDDKYEELVEKSSIFGVEGEVEINPELKQQFKSGKGIAGEVFNSGRPRLIQNVKKDRSFTFREDEKQNIKSLICVPLLIKDNAIGVMNIVNRREGRFGEEDLQTALTMANQAAVVIEKSRLYNLATIDGLTGLVVHRHFQAKMEEEFRRARRYGKHLSYLMTDIDHFKNFNDTWGHQVGDMVLREVAKIVRDSVRDTDVAARYGGEEFAVILPETDTDGAMLFAERIRQKVESADFPGPKGDLKVTMSVGVSSIPHNKPETPLEMIKLADEALYVCKHNGRNRVELAVDNDSSAH